MHTSPTRRRIARPAGAAFLASALLAGPAVAIAPAAPAAAAPQDVAALVNPFVGTESEGNAYPGATAPFGMVQLSPDNTNDYGSTSYSNDAGEVWGFSHRHINSAGCPAAGEVLVTPSTTETPITARTATPILDQASSEAASAGYYRVGLEGGVTAELTASTRVGAHRYTFPEGETANVSVNVGETLRNAGASGVRWVDDRTLEGYVYSSGFCGDTAESPYFFSATFDRAAESTGTWGADGVYVPGSAASDVAAGLNGAVATFDTADDRDVELSVGVSYVSVEGARANRVAEATDGGEQVDFDTIRQRTTDVWNAELGRFDVTTTTDEQRRIFFTQLYKSLISPTTGTDVDGSYRGMDLETHVADGWTYYQNFSLWDTYRSQATFHALFAADRAEDIVRSMYRARVEGGWLPRWALGPVETNIMAGDPVTPWLAENFALGTVPADIEDELWGYLVENATTVRPEGVVPLGRLSADYYLENGHVPYYPEEGGGLGTEFEEYRHGGSATMEFALGDAAVGAAAQRLGRTDVAAAFLPRGRNWQTLWNPDVPLTGGFTGIVNAVTAEGAFVSAPETASVQQSGFHEGTPWHYQWMTPQDVTGLSERMGGDEAFADRLDYYFDMPALQAQPGVSPAHWAEGGSTYYESIGYNPGNEPMMGNAWLYGYVGQPAKTNDVLAANLNRYPNSPGGGVGNDDVGTLSSWFVLASLGMQPVMPGSGIMALNAPRVLSASITMDDGDVLAVEAPGATTDVPSYIRGVEVDGVAQSAAWFDVDRIRDGGSLGFDLAQSAEGLEWGTAPEDRIPSVSDPVTADVDVQPAADVTAVAGAVDPVDVATVRFADRAAADEPITATVDAGSGAQEASVRAEGDAWVVSTRAGLGDAPGARTLAVTVTSAAEVPRFAPAHFAPRSISVAATVVPAAGSGDAGADPGGDGPADAGAIGSDSGTSGPLAYTGASPLPAVLVAAALLIAGVLLRVRRRERRG